jgi:hypothetical protein
MESYEPAYTNLLTCSRRRCTEYELVEENEHGSPVHKGEGFT